MAPRIPVSGYMASFWDKVLWCVLMATYTPARQIAKACATAKAQ